jgi:hypothetical protein
VTTSTFTLRGAAALALVLLGTICFVAPGAYAASKPPTVVSITFDDGFASQMRAAPMLKRYGMRGTFYINSELLNGEDRLTFAQVRALAQAGNEIGGHTSDHTDLVTVDPAERRRQVCDDRVALARIAGRAPRSFAYPYGASNAATERIVARCGYSSARIVGGVHNGSACPACPLSESLAPMDRYRVRTSFSFVSSTRVSDAEAAIAAAARDGGGWVPLVFHQVCDDCSALAIRPADLRSLLAWIAAHRSDGVVVRTMGGVIGGAAQPLVKAPFHDGPYGRLVNARLAQAGAALGVGRDVQGDGVDMQESTRCWRRAGYGVSKVKWSRQRVGMHGSMAETAVVSGYVSGDRKLIVRPDGGSCSVRVTDGTEYRVSVWYRTTARVSLTAYVRDSAGRWRYWAKSAAAPTSKGWTKFSYVLPPVPAGVANISFGAAIAGNGSMTIDHFGIAVTHTSAPASKPNVLGSGLSFRALLGVILAGLLLLPVLGAAAYDRVRRRRAS